MFGNNMATKIRIADILRIIQIMWIVCAKTYKQNCLGHTYKERVGVSRFYPMPHNKAICGHLNLDLIAD